jgi:carboxypeptidase D
MSLTSPPTKLAKIAIGNGAMGREAEFEDASTVSLRRVNSSSYSTTLQVSLIETHPELINFNITMYEEFVAKSHLCGYDLNLTYPQTGGHFPVLKNGFEDRKHADIESRQDMLGRLQSLVNHVLMTKAQAQSARRSFPPASYVFERRALQAQPNVTLDPHHQCAILNELLYYVRDHVAPWSEPYGFNWSEHC